MGVKIGSANLIAWAAGDDEGEFLAEMGADKIENIAADAGNLANVGEINPRRIGVGIEARESGSLLAGPS